MEWHKKLASTLGLSKEFSLTSYNIGGWAGEANDDAGAPLAKDIYTHDSPSFICCVPLESGDSESNRAEGIARNSQPSKLRNT